MPSSNPIERGIERTLFAARWLMVPMYLGLVAALAILVVVFLGEVVYYVPQVFALSADSSILVALTLIDLTLAANLLLIVLFSGYESFVSRLDTGSSQDRPGWMGTVDFGGLKLKLIASIVAISGIHLLKRFMEIGKGTEGALAERELLWLVIIHLVFVISGVFMAAMDWISARARKA